MITEIIEFAGFDGHLVPICISARNSRLDGDGCFDLLGDPGKFCVIDVK